MSKFCHESNYVREMQIENVNTGNSCLGANSLYNIAKIGSGFDFEKAKVPI